MSGIENVCPENSDGELVSCEPHAIVLEDGSILTVFYAKPKGYSSAVIMQVIWKYAE